MPTLKNIITEGTIIKGTIQHVILDPDSAGGNFGIISIELDTPAALKHYITTMTAEFSSPNICENTHIIAKAIGISTYRGQEQIIAESAHIDTLNSYAIENILKREYRYLPDYIKFAIANAYIKKPQILTLPHLKDIIKSAIDAQPQTKQTQTDLDNLDDTTNRIYDILIQNDILMSLANLFCVQHRINKTPNNNATSKFITKLQNITTEIARDKDFNRSGLTIELSKQRKNQNALETKPITSKELIDIITDRPYLLTTLYNSISIQKMDEIVQLNPETWDFDPFHPDRLCGIAIQTIKELQNGLSYETQQEITKQTKYNTAYAQELIQALSSGVDGIWLDPNKTFSLIATKMEALTNYTGRISNNPNCQILQMVLRTIIQDWKLITTTEVDNNKTITFAHKATKNNTIANTLKQAMQYSSHDITRKHIQDFDDEYNQNITAITKLTTKTDPDQTSAIYKTLNNRVSIITGGPGTGKSKTIAKLAILWLDKNPKHHYVLCLAPSHQARLNLQEKIEETIQTLGRTYDINQQNSHIISMTIQKQAIYSQDLLKTQKWLIICDEMSMVDTATLYNALSNLSYEHEIKNVIKHIVFVGDNDQLQPIEYGAPFYQMIENKSIPHTQLTTQHRFILTGENNLLNLFEHVRAGNTEQSFNDIRTAQTSIVSHLTQKHITENDMAHIALKEYFNILHKIINNKPGDITDLLLEATNATCLISPFRIPRNNNRSSITTATLNLKIQEKILGDALSNTYTSWTDLYDQPRRKYRTSRRRYQKSNIFGKLTMKTGWLIHKTKITDSTDLRFRIKSKIIATNTVASDDSQYNNITNKKTCTTWHNGHKLQIVGVLDITNTHINQTTIQCGAYEIELSKYDLPKKGLYAILYDERNELGNNTAHIVSFTKLKENFDLAYALTTHKAQGSEFNEVVIIIPNYTPYLSDFLSRNNFYTAISRAKQKVILVGSEQTLFHQIITPARVRQDNLSYLMKIS